MTSAQYRFRPINLLGATTARWLVFVAIGEGIMAAWSAADIFVLSNFDTLSQRTLDTWSLTGLIGFVHIALYFTTVVIAARWIYRANANTRANHRKLETPPPWAVGWFFIPFANLWKPYKAMAEMARANRRSGTDLPLGPWWAAWLISGIVGNISARLAFSGNDPSTLMTSSVLGVIASLAGIAAALLFRRIVMAVTEAQTAQLQAEVF